MLVKYESNNSGGSWWLKDKNWKDLEKAGWYVVWGGRYFCTDKSIFSKRPEGKPDCGLAEKCQGHRKAESIREVEIMGWRWLDAPAKEANKEFPSIEEALREFQEITGLNPASIGCDCCGPPHMFIWKDESGESHFIDGGECSLYM